LIRVMHVSCLYCAAFLYCHICCVVLFVLLFKCRQTQPREAQYSLYNADVPLSSKSLCPRPPVIGLRLSWWPVPTHPELATTSATYAWTPLWGPNGVLSAWWLASAFFSAMCKMSTYLSIFRRYWHFGNEFWALV